MNFLEYFTDSVLQAPTIGCMLMCLSGALIGTFAVLRKKSLIGEVLSHACYPGVVVALLIDKFFFSEKNSEVLPLIFVLVGAFLACLLATYAINFLERRFQVTTDASLSFILILFFGIGIGLLSALQQDFPSLYKELQSYLFGQAATMTEIHVMIYAILSLISSLIVFLLYRPLITSTFDPVFSETTGYAKKLSDTAINSLIVLAVIVGIRSVGVVLMSAMLIFPVLTAKCLSNRLSYILLLASVFGLLSGFFGVYFSHELSYYFTPKGGKFLSFPTGPVIVLVASILFVLSILFSPRTGLVFRFYRRWSFSLTCQKENLLKSLWKFCSKENRNKLQFEEIESMVSLHPFKLKMLVRKLVKNGWLKSVGNQSYEVTPSGMLWGKKIVRLHRLWELYLVKFCNVAKDRVHPSAEKMEHIITPEIEHELTYLLHNPDRDPHKQPIPHLDNNEGSLA